MSNTIFLSQLLGLFFVVTGLSMLGSRNILLGVFKSFYKNRAFTYFFGVLVLCASLAILINHNLWNRAEEIVVSTLGWIMFLESIMYLFLPQKYMTDLLEWIENKKFYYIQSGAYFIFGAYLVYVGFGI